MSQAVVIENKIFRLEITSAWHVWEMKREKLPQNVETIERFEAFRNSTDLNKKLSFISITPEITINNARGKTMVLIKTVIIVTDLPVRWHFAKNTFWNVQFRSRFSNSLVVDYFGVVVWVRVEFEGNRVNVCERCESQSALLRMRTQIYSVLALDQLIALCVIYEPIVSWELCRFGLLCGSLEAPTYFTTCHNPTDHKLANNQILRVDFYCIAIMKRDNN